jgi:hypothetical protein
MNKTHITTQKCNVIDIKKITVMEWWVVYKMKGQPSDSLHTDYELIREMHTVNSTVGGEGGYQIDRNNGFCYHSII